MADPNAPDPAALFALYRYRPAAVAAGIACGAFAVVTALHLWCMLRSRTFYSIPFVFGGIFELIGYGGRIWSHMELDSVLGYTMQLLFILIAPALMAASIYVILGRITGVLGAEHHSVIPLRFLTKVFVLGDVISFIAQRGGGGIQATAFFGFSMVATVVFDRRISARPTQRALQGIIPWRRYLVVLHATSSIIMIPSVFRVIEYVQGNSGYIVRREYLLYIFDTFLMFLVMAVFLAQYIEGLDAGRNATKLDDEIIDLMETPSAGWLRRFTRATTAISYVAALRDGERE